MTAWIIRGGRYGEREEEALNNGFLTIGFGIIKSLDNVQTPDDVAGCLDLPGNETNPQLASRVSQVWAFTVTNSPDWWPKCCAHRATA